MYNEMAGVKNEQNSFSTSTPPPLKWCEKLDTHRIHINEETYYTSVLVLLNITFLISFSVKNINKLYSCFKKFPSVRF